MTREIENSNETTASDRAAAAAWIARLHGEERTPQVEAGLRRWLAASASHRKAFELASDLWTEAERWPKRNVPEFIGWRRSHSRLTMPHALAAAAIVGLLLTGAIMYWRHLAISTGIGEQRNLTLADGTRLALNTATSVRVRYGQKTRLVELERGEALFEVAKSPSRPFVVMAGGRRVTAIGTAFVVRREDERLAVTLLQGKVMVSPATRETLPGRPLPSAGEDEQAAEMVPGERLSFIGNRHPEVDQPALSRVLAWQRGKIILDHTPLADAAGEMNRYSHVRLIIEDPRASRAEVTGIFRAGDSENFALAVADAYRLKVIREGDRIVLSGAPRKRHPGL
jgi:transmembrane sensor